MAFGGVVLVLRNRLTLLFCLDCYDDPLSKLSKLRIVALGKALVEMPTLTYFLYTTLYTGIIIPKNAITD